jgi:hypothetical protein
MQIRMERSRTRISKRPLGWKFIQLKDCISDKKRTTLKKWAEKKIKLPQAPLRNQSKRTASIHNVGKESKGTIISANYTEK